MIDHISGEDVKSKWKNLRDYYSDIKRKQKLETISGEGEIPGQFPKKKARKTWAMFEYVTWLDSFKSRSEQVAIPPIIYHS